MLDFHILKLLYLKKHDNSEFHDVSLNFNVPNHNNFYNEIENTENVTRNESQTNSKKIIRFITNLFRRSIDKETIDKTVIALEENGFVIKKVEGYIPPSAITSFDDPSDANNAIYKISPKGIEYYEKNKQWRYKVIFSIVSIILTLITIVISIQIF